MRPRDPVVAVGFPRVFWVERAFSSPPGGISVPEWAPSMQTVAGDAPQPPQLGSTSIDTGLQRVRDAEPCGFPWFEQLDPAVHPADARDDPPRDNRIVGILASRAAKGVSAREYLVLWRNLVGNGERLQWKPAAEVDPQYLEAFQRKAKAEEEDEEFPEKEERDLDDEDVDAPETTAGLQAPEQAGSNPVALPDGNPVPVSTQPRKRKTFPVIASFDIKVVLAATVFKDSFVPYVIAKNNPQQPPGQTNPADETIKQSQSAEDAMDDPDESSYRNSAIWDPQRSMKKTPTDADGPLFKGIYSREAAIFVSWVHDFIAAANSEKMARDETGVPRIQANDLLTKAGVAVATNGPKPPASRWSSYFPKGPDQAFRPAHARPEDIPSPASLPPVANNLRVDGNALYRKGKYLEATELYDKALKHAPTSAILWSNRAATNMQLNRAKEAFEDATKTVRLASRWPQGWARLSAAARRDGNMTVSFCALRYALALSFMPDKNWIQGLNDIKKSMVSMQLRIPTEDEDLAFLLNAVGKRPRDPSDADDVEAKRQNTHVV